MAKPRLCFTLLYAHENFHVSRNFSLQSVGGLDWLIENYEFDSIARAIDELIIINVTRGETDWSKFIETIQGIARFCFMPITVGGGIRTIEQAQSLFNGGADKIILNTPFFTEPDLIHQLVSRYGSQSIVASIDIRRSENGDAEVMIENGSEKLGMDLGSALSTVTALGVGEIYLTSIDQDGTGNGYDLAALELASKACSLPIIANGGADTDDRLSEGIHSGFASAVSTSHLFNFMCDGLKDARDGMIADGIELSAWDFSGLDK